VDDLRAQFRSLNVPVPVPEKTANGTQRRTALVHASCRKAAHEN